MAERGILRIWVDLTVDMAEQVESHSDGTIHYLRRIEDFGNRWLRVVVNPLANPSRVVTLFFDRRRS